MINDFSKKSIRKWLNAKYMPTLSKALKHDHSIQALNAFLKTRKRVELNREILQDLKDNYDGITTFDVNLFSGGIHKRKDLDLLNIIAKCESIENITQDSPELNTKEQFEEDKKEFLKVSRETVKEESDFEFDLPDNFKRRFDELAKRLGSNRSFIAKRLLLLLLTGREPEFKFGKLNVPGSEIHNL
jgi:Na+/phosphate symporter